jgi:hypothetical protein
MRGLPGRTHPGPATVTEGQEEHVMQRSRTEEHARPPTGGASGIRERLLVGVPVSERRLALAGHRTAVLEGGDGPPVVLLHGAGEFAAAGCG